MKVLCVLSAVLCMAGVARAQEVAPGAAASAPAGAVEARALQELKRMGDFLAATPRFALEAEESYDEVPSGEPKVELSNVRRIAVERPNHAAADATGDTLNRAAWYDGHTFTLLDKERNVYASIDAPPTLDAALDKLQDEYGVVLPLVDLLYADPYAVLTEGVTYGRYLGIHQAAGVPCHHLVFSQATIEWQIWIDAGAQPLPRRLAITYVQEAGEPKYAATIRKWKLNADAPAGLFTFQAPEGAQRVEAVRRSASGEGEEVR